MVMCYKVQISRVNMVCSYLVQLAQYGSTFLPFNECLNPEEECTRTNFDLLSNNIL